MAFVVRSRRETSEPLYNTPAVLGPGTYDSPISAIKRGRISYAPFGSSAERGVDSGYEPTEYVPGPGEYLESKVNTDFDTIHGPSALAATVFQSKVPRFNSQHMDGQTPGPGNITLFFALSIHVCI